MHIFINIVDKGFNIFNFKKSSNLEELAASTGLYHLLMFLHEIGGKSNNKESEEGIIQVMFHLVI